MAWKRYFRKQARRAKNWAKKRYLGPGGMGRVVKDVSMLKGLINTEKKTIRTAIATQGVFLNTPVTVIVNSLAAGSTAAGRVGNSIKMKSLQWSLKFENLTSSSNTYRMVIVYDRDPQGTGTTTAYTEIYTSGDVLALRNYDEMQASRFQVLKDITLRLDSSNNTQKIVKGYLKMSRYTKWSSSTADAHIRGRLMFIFCGDGAVVNTVNISGEVGCNYLDN